MFMSVLLVYVYVSEYLPHLLICEICATSISASVIGLAYECSMKRQI